MSQSKLPKKVVVGRVDYKPVLVPPKSKELVGGKPEKGVTYFGRMVYKEQKIYLANDQKDTMLKATLFHEVLHGVFAAVGGWASGVEEEKVVSMFSDVLLDTLSEDKSPGLAAFLFGNE